MLGAKPPSSPTLQAKKEMSNVTLKIDESIWKRILKQYYENPKSSVFTYKFKIIQQKTCEQAHATVSMRVTCSEGK